MNEVLEIANSNILYLGVAVLLGLVFWQAAVFIKRSLKRAKELQIPKSKLIKAARTAALTTIIPSIAVVIALLTLAPVLGIPIAWGRLSVIGSLAYELMAAQMGAGVMNATLGSASMGKEVFLIAVITMTVGSFAALGLNLFFFKPYKNKLNKSLNKNKENGWGKILILAIMISLYSRFMAEPIVQGGITLTTMLVSAGTTVLLNFLIKKMKINWMNDFVTSISMIAGMCSAIVISL